MWSCWSMGSAQVEPSCVVDPSVDPAAIKPDDRPVSDNFLYRTSGSSDLKQDHAGDRVRRQSIKKSPASPTTGSPVLR